MDRSFRRSHSSLGPLMHFLEEGAEAHLLDPDTRFGLRLVVEELFSNFVRHGSDSSGDILIEVDRLEGRVQIRFVEDDAASFDPTVLPEPDLTAPLADRAPGGLGLHLVRHYSDDLRYERVGRRNIVTVTKHVQYRDASDRHQ